MYSAKVFVHCCSKIHANLKPQVVPYLELGSLQT